MSELKLTKTRIADGLWEGRLEQPGAGPGSAPPDIRASLGPVPVEGVELHPDPAAPGLWTLRVPIPIQALGEGLHTLLIVDGAGGGLLSNCAVAIGLPLESEVRAELDLLRAELDLLKRAFRRHCVETG